MKFKIILFALIILTFSQFSYQVKAEELESFDVVSSDYANYDVDIFHVFSKGTTDSQPFTGYKLSDYLITGFIKDGTQPIFGKCEWSNPGYVIKTGAQEVTINFISDNTKIHPDFSFKVYLYGVDRIIQNADGPSEPTKDEQVSNIEQLITPSLTAASIIMNKGNTYDINVNDKVDGAYVWSSSNPKIAKVNAKNGIVTAVANGKAKITCKITGNDGQAYSLTSTITVGIDDNFPVLNDDTLDLSIGDKYDLDVENQIAKSKYQYKSSDRAVATVNASNGIVTAKGVGTANIYCTITTPEKQIIILKCAVTVTK